jgi:hypothetical protein
MPNYREERPGAGATSQEQSGSHHKTHEELVAGFRMLVKTEQKEHREKRTWNFPPERIIQISLYKKIPRGG